MHLPASPACRVLLLDDDTFVNVPVLLQLLARYPKDLPLAMGHVLDHMSRPDGLTWFNGGAGESGRGSEGSPCCMQVVVGAGTPHALMQQRALT
mgnify:CR=1 FL=1